MWKRRRLRKKSSGTFVKIFLIFFILIVIILMYLIVTKSGLFAIKQIEIEEEQLTCVNENQLTDVSNLRGQNLLFINIPKVIDNLKKKFYCIKSIEISKQLPGNVKLQIFGRQPAAILLNLKYKEASLSSLINNIATPEATQIQDLFVLDNEGVAFAKENGLNIPKIYTYNSGVSLGNKVKDDQIDNVLIILDKVKILGVSVEQSWIYNNFLIISPDSQKPKIIFKLDNQIDVQLASLQLILAEAKINHGTIPPDGGRNRRTVPNDIGIDLEDLEFIDLRFDKPVIRITPKK